MNSNSSCETGPGGERSSGLKRVIICEDVLILVSIALLFVLGVFYREALWGQIALGGLLVVMIVVLVARYRRVHKAFKEADKFS